MIERHPHVFGSEKASDASEVKANWEKRKREGRDPKSDPLGTVPKGLPSLSAALRMSERAADLGFDWERDADLLAKVEEEIGEARREAEMGNAAGSEEELGDLLFALANWGRKLKIDPERALRLANEKFRRRFHRVAELAHGAGPGRFGLLGGRAGRSVESRQGRGEGRSSETRHAVTPRSRSFGSRRSRTARVVGCG